MTYTSYARSSLSFDSSTVDLPVRSRRLRGDVWFFSDDVSRGLPWWFRERADVRVGANGKVPTKY